jgi:hypothetical protein
VEELYHLSSSFTAHFTAPQYEYLFIFILGDRISAYTRPKKASMAFTDSKIVREPHPDDRAVVVAVVFESFYAAHPNVRNFGKQSVQMRLF